MATKQRHASEFDVGAKGEAQASPDALKRLRAAIAKAGDMEELIERMEDNLKAAKATLYTYKSKTIPDIMAEIQSDNFSHAGWQVSKHEFYSGSLPKDPVKQKEALNWLQKHDGGGLIKTEVAIEFGKSQAQQALKLARELKKQGFAVNVDASVHPQSLLAYVRQRVKDGDEIDFEKLGIFSGTVAKLQKLDPKTGKPVKKPKKEDTNG